MIHTVKEGSTSWKIRLAIAIPAIIPVSFAKNWASACILGGIVAKHVISPTVKLMHCLLNSVDVNVKEVNVLSVFAFINHKLDRMNANNMIFSKE